MYYWKFQFETTEKKQQVNKSNKTEVTNALVYLVMHRRIKSGELSQESWNSLKTIDLKTKICGEISNSWAEKKHVHNI